MGKGTGSVPSADGRTREVALPLPEAGLGRHGAKHHLWRTRAPGRKASAACPLLHPLWQEQPPPPRAVFHTNCMPASQTSKVPLLPDAGGLAVEGREARGHKGCILEGFSLSFLLLVGKGLARCPHFRVMGNKSCKLPSSDCAALLTVLTTSERGLRATQRWSGHRSGGIPLSEHLSQTTGILSHARHRGVLF